MQKPWYPRLFGVDEQHNGGVAVYHGTYFAVIPVGRTVSVPIKDETRFWSKAFDKFP